MVLYEAQHSRLLTDHYSTAITNCLFNHSFWASVEQTKELQDIFFFFGGGVFYLFIYGCVGSSFLCEGFL